MDNIISCLLYAGYDKEEFEALMSQAAKKNESNLRMGSLFAMIVFAGLCCVSLLLHGFSSPNALCDGLASIACGLLFSCLEMLWPARPRTAIYLGYAFIATLYAFSLAMLLLHPEQPAVMPDVVLLMAPLLLVVRPICQISMIVIQTLGICVFASLFKSYEAAQTDIGNAAIFGGISMISGMLYLNARFRVLALSRQVRHLCEEDAPGQSRRKR